MRAEAPDWARRYIGIPFRDKGRSIAGCDCFGLLRIIFAERWQIEIREIQAYAGTGQEDAPVCAKLHAEELSRGDWAPVEPGREQEGDVVVVRVIGLPWHYAVVAVPGVAIHTMSSRQGSVLLRYRDPRYRHIIAQPGGPVQGSGFYRHRLMAA